MSPIVFNLTNNPCIIFSDSMATIARLRLATSLLGFLLCMLAALVIACFQLYRKFTHRLYAYLTLANMVYSAVFTIQYIAVDYEAKLVFHVPCIVAGFLIQYTGWAVLLFTTVITLHLFLIIVFKRNFTSKKLEVSYVFFSVGFPLLICWIPFIHDTYGLAGDWCWIRWADFTEVENPGRCPLHTEGVIEKILLWSAPMIFLVLVSFIAALVMIGVLIRRATGHSMYNEISKQYKVLLKEALPFLIFPVLFYLICIIEMANHIFYAIHFHDPNFGLWVVNAIGAPMRAVPIILALLCPGVLGKWKRRRELLRSLDVLKHKHCDTSFNAGDEHTQQPKLVSSFDKTSGLSYSNRTL